MFSCAIAMIFPLLSPLLDGGHLEARGIFYLLLAIRTTKSFCIEIELIPVAFDQLARNLVVIRL